MDFSSFLKSLQQTNMATPAAGGDPSLAPASPAPMSMMSAPPLPNPDVISMLGAPQIRPDLVTPQNPPGLSPLLSPMKSEQDMRPEATNVEDFNRAQQTPKALKKEAKAQKAVDKQSLKDEDIVDVNSLDPKAVETAKTDATSKAQKAQYTGNADDLVAAQKSRDDFMNKLLMMQGAEDIGRSFAKIGTTNNQLLKDLSPLAQQKVTDVIQKQEFQKKGNEESRAQAAESRAETTEERNAQRAPIEMAQMQKNLEKEGVSLEAAKAQLKDLNAQRDPNSDVSKASISLANQMSKAAGINLSIPPNMSYSQMQQLYPSVTKFIDAKMTTDARKDALAIRKEEKADKELVKSDNLLDKRFEKLSGKLDEQMASGRSGLGTDVKNYNSIQNIKALIAGDMDLNHLDNRELYEVARSLDRVLSQGGSTISGAEHLTPDTARTRVAKLMEFVSGRRQSAGAGSFVTRTLNTLNREEEQAKVRINNSKLKTLAGAEDLIEKSPERWERLLNRHGIPTDVLEKGQQQSSSQKKEAESKATPHGGKYPPGSVVTVKGKNYVVGADGDSLTAQ